MSAELVVYGRGCRSDIDQFLALQREAVEALAEERRKSAAWVELLHLYTVPWWQYREAEGDEPAGVVINLHPSGSVETREGLVRHELKESVVEATRSTPVAPRPAPKRPEFGADLLRYISSQRSAAVQAALLGNPRKAKEVAVLLLLAVFPDQHRRAARPAPLPFGPHRAAGAALVPHDP